MCIGRSIHHDDDSDCDRISTGWYSGSGVTPLRRLCTEGLFPSSTVRRLEGRSHPAELDGEPINGDDLADALAQGAVVRG
jgi:hypothetical protein